VVDIYLCVSFGYGPDAEVWAASITAERLLQLGEAASINLTSEDEEVYTIESEIIFVGETNEGNNYAVAASEDPISDENFREALIFSEWTLLSGEDAVEVSELIDSSPPVAALHDLLLVIGDYKSKDEFGYPDKIQVWHRLIEPDDVSVPLFGEKFLSHIVLSNGEVEYDDSEEGEDLILEEGTDLTEIFQREIEVNFDDYADMIEEPVVYLEEPQVELTTEGTPEKGYPVLSFYTAKTGYGVASIGVWAPNIEPYTDFDLIADGWEQLGPELFNALEFRLEERIDLASKTNLVLYYDEDGNRFISQYALTHPEEVSENQFDLIPIALQDFVEDVKAMNVELEDIDNVVGEWLSSEESAEEGKKD
jgi:hypothetical protein